MNCLLHLLVFLVAAVEMTVAGRFKVKCKEEKVTAKAGDDDVIQCRFYSGNKVGSVAFVWKKADTMGIVYNYSRSQGNQTEQDPIYRNRAEVFANEIPEGNLSLRLRNMSLSDTGIYKLHVSSRSQSTDAQVFLSIRGQASKSIALVAQRRGDNWDASEAETNGSYCRGSGVMYCPRTTLGTQPVIHSSGDDLGLLVLVCESSGWYPAPSVTWENGLGENLTRHSHTELFNCTGGSVCVKSTLELMNWPTSNYTCTMWDQQLDEGLSTTFSLIHRIPLGTVIGATGASICAFVLIVAVCWSWW